MREQAPQVLEVEQQQAIVVGILEGNGDDALLRVIELKQAREQLRAHLGNRRADRMTALAIEIPEHAGSSAIGDARHADLGDALVDLLQRLAFGRSGDADTRQVTLHVCAEHRHPGGGKLFRHDLQGYGLARARRPSHQPVPVRARQQQALRRFVIRSAAAKENAVSHAERSRTRRIAIRGAAGGKASRPPAMKRLCSGLHYQ